MKQPSITHSVAQSVDYLGHTHKWTDTDVISSHKKVCQQPDTFQEKLREERDEQKRQEKLSKSSLHVNELSQEVDQQSQQFQHEINNNDAMIVDIGKYVRKENNPVSPKALKW
jgi:hypothetical protein